ncbi:PAS domain S-box-containing protein [Daejeonella rubra]|uniref:histidine kinase n=2 Tax=Daejeonella rubra TaxID=990371 RepID=A0A1G9YL68_9SPHI|nr:PAS domain S-box-containing protein [Daejeonella rubra]
MSTGHGYKFEHFFELSPDLLCIAGFDGYLKKINPAVANLLGYSIQELMTKPIIEMVHPDDRDSTISSQQIARSSGPLLNFENRYITSEGNIVWLSWTSLAFKEEKLIYAIAKNITYKKILEEKRNNQLANLTKVNNDLKQLSYTTSHDLRSPVGNLVSLLEMIDYSKITDPENLKYLEFIKMAAENLRKAVDNSVDQLIKKDQINIEIEEINLNEILNRVLTPIKSFIINSNVTIKAEFTALETIKFNKAYLESIFLNLITNSIKYAQPGLSPEITITSNRINGINQLVFSDNGLGFDLEKFKGKIFGLNQTFHDASDSKGIGLYLVYNHVNNLGGRITLDSKVNEGSTFTIFFKD